MSRDARKKEKQRLKREKKRREARRASSLTPLDRIARSGGGLECYLNTNWREVGLASIHVLGHAPGDRLCRASFLVDVWCVGLKDVTGRKESTRDEFEDALDVVRGTLDLVRVPPAEVRRLVAGGIRFARQNGFKLPPHYDRWTAIFGDLGDVEAADVADFGIDGGLRYVGTADFLRRRLVACSVDEFLARPDVHFVIGDGPVPASDLADYDEADDLDADEEADDDEADPELLAALQQMVGNTGRQMEDVVRKWCFTTGQAPHPRLHDAVATLLVSTLPLAMSLGAAEEDIADADEAMLPDVNDLMAMGLDGLPADDRRSVEEAMDQVAQFMQQFKDPAEMLAAVDAASRNPGALPPPA